MQLQLVFGTFVIKHDRIAPPDGTMMREQDACPERSRRVTRRMRLSQTKCGQDDFEALCHAFRLPPTLEANLLAEAKPNPPPQARKRCQGCGRALWDRVSLRRGFGVTGWRKGEAKRGSALS